jgi:hypothetical protein
MAGKIAWYLRDLSPSQSKRIVRAQDEITKIRERLTVAQREDWDAFAHGGDEPMFFSPVEEVVALRHYDKVRNDR